MRLHATALAVLILAAGAANAEVYRWVDDQGQVHYGDRPPKQAGRAATGSRVPIAPPPPVDASAAERAKRRDKFLKTLSQERAERRAAEAKARQARTEHAQKCQRARKTLALYERSNLLYRKGKDDNRDYMSDAERDATIKTLREGIDRSCKSG